MSSTLTFKQRFQLDRFINGENPGTNPVILTHRRIFILPTLRGLGFVLLIAIILLIAFVYNNNLAYLLGFLLASIFFITILHSFAALSGLILRKGKSQSVFAGEACLFTILIDNPSQLARFNLQFKLGKQFSLQTDIPAANNTTVSLYSVTEQRGWQRMKPVTVSSTYPLGLFRAWSPVNFDFSVLIYPKPEHHQMPFPQSESDAATNQKGANHKGSDDFSGLQEYQAGDSIRQIHWKAFAKGQGLFSKHYTGASSSEIWLDYQCTPGENSEQRLSRLCKWVIDAEQTGIRYGFSLPGIRLDPGSGPGHQRQCLEALALF